MSSSGGPGSRLIYGSSAPTNSAGGTSLPGRRGVVGDWPLAAPVYLLTAYNPRGEELPLDENERRLTELDAYLRAELVAAVRSIGASEDGSWMEPGFALLDVGEADALAIARRFEQAAIYAWSAERLEVVGALDEGRASVGWSLAEEPELPRSYAFWYTGVVPRPLGSTKPSPYP